MKSHKTIYTNIILASLGIILVVLASCSGPHHGSGNHKNHMSNSMGG